MLSHIYDRLIEWGDCDPAGVVFNPNYFAYFNQGTTELFELAGWRDHDLGGNVFVGCPLVEIAAEFRTPCTYGDRVTIVTSVLDVRRSSVDIRNHLLLADMLCVEAVETRVWCVRDAATGRVRSEQLPDGLSARLRSEA